MGKDRKKCFWVIVFIFACFISACSNILSDVIAPIPGNSGVIEIIDDNGKELNIRWVKANEDKVTYKVYTSKNDNISDIQNIVENGEYKGEVYNGSSYKITELSPETTYYINLISQDSKGNKSSYKYKSYMTAKDGVSPRVPVL